MKTLRGITVNLPSSIIGVVSNNVSRIDGYVLAPEELPCSVGLSKETAGRTDGPCVHSVSKLTEFGDKDVVLVNPSGLMTVLYSYQGNDNSLFVTDRCNAACIMCPQPSPICPTSHLKVNKCLIRLIDKATPVLGLTGGEPTTAPDELIELIMDCKTHLPAVHLDILTNGIALADVAFVRKIMDIRHPSMTFHVPLYADTDREHNAIVGTEGFHATVEGLYNLARFRQRIELRMVIMKSTYQRLPMFAQFVCRNLPFVSHVALMGLEPVGSALRNLSDVWVEPLDAMPQIRGAVQCLHRADLNVSLFNFQLCILPEELRPFAVRSISDWKNMYLEFCGGCAKRTVCGGLFNSQHTVHSRFLGPVSQANRNTKEAE